MESAGFFVGETWLEQFTDAMETLSADRMMFLSGSSKVFVVPFDNTALAYDSLRVYTSHFTLLWKEVSQNPLASLQWNMDGKAFSRNGNIRRHQR